MKFMIGVDLEGVACTVGAPEQPLTDGVNYQFACQQAVREANAAAAALFDSGATEVYIWDNHGSSLNLQYDKLDDRCEIVMGTGARHRWPGIDNTFAGVLLIGYHPMDNTIDGVLCHTFSSKTLQWVKINEVEVGEIAIDAAMANEVAGVPVIFVASDYQGTVEAKRFLPWVETVYTKRGLGRNLAVSKHPMRAAREIYEGVKRAVERIGEMRVFSFGTPIVQQCRYKRIESAQRLILNSPEKYVMIDPYTVECRVEKLSDIY
ncbi:MAG: M55 family metallopeptidase [Firmicutes bacterium]|nr:M55 family metallopeptidase [Bacillota bacterium]